MDAHSTTICAEPVQSIAASLRNMVKAIRAADEASLATTAPLAATTNECPLRAAGGMFSNNMGERQQRLGMADELATKHGCREASPTSRRSAGATWG
jgi:hypothetical protein